MMLYSILEELRLSMANCAKIEDRLLLYRCVCVCVWIRGQWHPQFFLEVISENSSSQFKGVSGDDETLFVCVCRSTQVCVCVCMPHDDSGL